MKDENVLLTMCLAVIFAFVGGLTVQSCKSTKVTQSTRLEVDTARHTEEAKKILADSTFWESLKANIKLEWVQERYIPVQDSTGRITGSVLAERCAVTSSREEQRDSGTAIRKEEAGSVISSTSGKTRLVEDIKTEKKPVWSVSVYVFVGLFMTILAIIYFRKFHKRFLK